MIVVATCVAGSHLWKVGQQRQAAEVPPEARERRVRVVNDIVSQASEPPDR